MDAILNIFRAVDVSYHSSSAHAWGGMAVFKQTCMVWHSRSVAYEKERQDSNDYCHSCHCQLFKSFQQVVPMHYTQSLLQCWYCAVNLTVHAKFTISLKKKIVIYFMGERMLNMFKTPRGDRLFNIGLGSKAQRAFLSMCHVFVTGINRRCVQSAACFERYEGTSLYHILPSESIPWIAGEFMRVCVIPHCRNQRRTKTGKLW